MKYTDYFLKGDPFRTLFTDAMVKDIDKLIVGRVDELEEVKEMIESQNSIFLNGMFGVGKTIFLRKLFVELSDSGHFVIFVNGLGDFDSIEKNILNEILTKLLQEEFQNINDNELNDIFSLLLGNEITKTRSSKFGINKYVTLAKGNIHLEKKALNISYTINKLLDYIKSSGQSVFIIIDDLDLYLNNYGELEKLVLNIRKNFIKRDIPVIIAGHPFFLLSGLSSFSDILIMKQLSFLKGEDFKEMVFKYLQWKRTPNFSNGKNKYFPFNEDVVEYIAHTFANLKWSTRLLQNSFKMILNYHKKKGICPITMESLELHWSQIIEKALSELKPEDLQIFKLINENGGAISPNKTELLDKICNNELLEYSEIVTKFKGLLQKDMIIQKGDGFKTISLFSFDFIKSFGKDL